MMRLDRYTAYDSTIFVRVISDIIYGEIIVFVFQDTFKAIPWFGDT